MEREILLVAHNLRSCHNVGSLLRTADGLGVSKVYLTGYTPYPIAPDDNRLPHLADRLHSAIHKTALGAELTQKWEHRTDCLVLIEELLEQSFKIYALEQTDNAVPLPDLEVPKKIAIIVGREVDGVEPEILDVAQQHVMIPMSGEKESFNVVQAAAMALYHCRFAK